MEHRASNCNALVTTHYFSLLEGTKVEAMIQAHENEISLDSGKSGELLNKSDKSVYQRSIIWYSRCGTLVLHLLLFL